MNRKVLGIGLSLAVGICSQGAWAQSQSEDPETDRCSSEEPGFCLDGVSSTVTSFDGLRIGSRSSAVAKRQHQAEVADASAKNWQGWLMQALGDGGASGINPWFAYARSSFDSEVRIAKYSAETDQVQFGADRMLGPDWLLGVALGVESTQTQTRYNGGGQDSDGSQFTVYGSHWLNDTCSLNLMLGYGSSSNDQRRIDRDDSTAGNPVFVRASFDSSRVFADLSGSTVSQYGRWGGAGRVGLMYAQETVDAYQETGGSTARAVGETEPSVLQAYLSGESSRSFRYADIYGLVGYRRDLSRDKGQGAGGLPANVGETVPDDADEFELALGARMFRANGFSGSLEWLETFGRKDFSNSTITLIARMEF